MLTAVPQQYAGDLYQPQVVGGLLLVAHQNGAAFREPAQCALHHPSSRRVAFLSLRILLFFADAPDMRNVAVAFEHFPNRVLVVALVQTQVLGRRLGRLGTLDHDGLKGSFEQLEVGYVRSGYHHRQRSSGGLDQKGAFDPVLSSIGGIGTYLIPPKRALPIAPSAACHSKSTPPSSSHSSMSLSQIRSKTPFSIHLWKVLCTEESSGKCSGSWFHWQPLRIRKMIASRAARWSTRGRPVLFGGSCSWRIEDRFDDLPQPVGGAPDGGKWLLLGRVLGHRQSLFR